MAAAIAFPGPHERGRIDRGDPSRRARAGVALRRRVRGDRGAYPAGAAAKARGLCGLRAGARAPWGSRDAPCQYLSRRFGMAGRATATEEALTRYSSAAT